jgi:hypothetical protein
MAEMNKEAAMSSKAGEFLSAQSLPRILQMDFYEKALFVKGDVATAPGLTQLLCALRALCFYPHFRGAHTLSLWWLGASWDPS